MGTRPFEVIADRIHEPLLLVHVRGVVVAANRAAHAVLGPSLEGTDLLIRTDAPARVQSYIRMAVRSTTAVPSRVTFDGGSTAWRTDASRASARLEEEPLVLLHLRSSSRAHARFAALDKELERLHAEIRRRQALERERSSLLALERSAREQAEAASRLKDEFLASVSHELRTPLHAIAGWAGLIRQKLGDPEWVRRGLDVIERNVAAQTELTNDLLDASRAITGRMRLDVRSVDLAVVVRQAIEGARPAADAKGIVVELHADAGGCMINGDPERLLQIFWNLLSNATKHTDRNGHIQVTLRRVESHVEAVVSDTGQGIAADLLPFVFDRFRQADGTTTRRHGGLGLGLSIVRHLVELHGGVAMAHSDGPGLGATFIISLPLPRFRRTSAVNLLALTPPGSPEAAALHGLHVLLVEDHDDSRELLESILRSNGAEVTAAAGSADAQRLFQAHTFHAVLSDLEMPDEDGFTLIRKLRRLEHDEGRARTPAVAVTAHSMASARVHALRAGFQAFAAKPVDTRELVALLATLCERSD